MQKEFLNRLFEKHQKTENFPATSAISKLVTKVILTLFPEQAKKKYQDVSSLNDAFLKLETELVQLLTEMPKNHLPEAPVDVAKNYFQQLPSVYDTLLTDIEAILSGDPAATTEYDVVRSYPGFYAIAFYRLAHVMYNQKVELLPRILTEFAHSKTGIDIHPGASISPYFCIDHGTGIVIGETTEIGEHVKVYQGVTLGALSVDKSQASKKRHPTIENNVVIYAGATILGGGTTIGHSSVIGGNTWITESLPPYSKVYHRPQTEFSTK